MKKKAFVEPETIKGRLIVFDDKSFGFYEPRYQPAIPAVSKRQARIIRERDFQKLLRLAKKGARG